MSDLSHIDLKNIPEHIAIIADGNGGRKAMVKIDYLVIQRRRCRKETLKTARELNENSLTLYAFSTENWNRPQKR